MIYHFQAVVEEMEKPSDIGEANAYFSPKFANKFLLQYISILPLWSGLGQSKNQERLSNANVEAWFSVTKTHILNGKPADTIGDFERIMRPSVIGRLKVNLQRLQNDRIVPDDKDVEVKNITDRFVTCVKFVHEPRSQIYHFQNNGKIFFLICLRQSIIILTK